MDSQLILEAGMKEKTKSVDAHFKSKGKKVYTGKGAGQTRRITFEQPGKILRR